MTDQQLLSAAFNRTFTCARQRRSEVISALKLWVLLNSDSCGASLHSSISYVQQMVDALEPDLVLGGVSGTCSSAASVPPSSSAIVLSADAIRAVLESLAKIPALDVGDWTAVLRSIAWLSR